MNTRIAPEQIYRRLKVWSVCFWFWNILHYALGLAATIGTVIIAAGKSVNDAQAVTNGMTVQPTLGIAVAVCTAILTFAKVSLKASAYVQAWRHLDSARVKYELDDTATLAELAAALHEGETMITKSD